MVTDVSALGSRRGGAATTYRGRDRRSPSLTTGLSAGWLLRWGAAGGLTMLVAAAGVTALAPSAVGTLWRVAFAVWCTATLASGLALLGAWRVSGRARPARLGMALVTSAALISLLPLTITVTGPRAGNPEARSVALVVILAISGAQVIGAVRGNDVDTLLRPVRRLPLLLVCTALYAVLSVWLATPAIGDSHHVNLLPVWVCLALATSVLTAGRRRPTAAVGGLAAAVLLFGVGLSGRLAPDDTWVAGTTAVALAISAAVLGGLAAGGLRLALTGHDIRSRRTLAALAEYRTASSLDRERRHDALSALSAIRSASDILTTRGAALDPATRESLAAAVRGELSRVERMLAPEPCAGPVDVDLARVVAPVVLAWRAQGMPIDGPAEGCVVRVEPDVLARIANNVLHNAHRHAPGATVRLRADACDDVVRLHLVDDGPGIAPRDRSRLFEPGVTSSSGGEGLGLASARRLAREQGGDLSLGDVAEGFSLVLTLPRGVAPASTLPVSRRQVE